MAKRKLRRVHVADARHGIDVIEFNEAGGCNCLVDTNSEYAPVRISNEREDLERFRHNLPSQSLDRLGRFGQLLRRHGGMLTVEQRRTRLDLISAEWKSRYGDALFVVE